MPLGKELGLGPGDIVLDEDPAPARKRGRGTATATFGPMYCGHSAGWTKMSLGTEATLC